MTEIQNQLPEIFSQELLSFDELKALEGIDYNFLPDSFNVSRKIFNACGKVWSAFKNHYPWHESEAHKRTTAYFQPLDKKGDWFAEQFMRRRAAQWEDAKKLTEFGRQFYAAGRDVIQGKLVKGQRFRVALRNNLDGLPDNSSIVHIHNHPNNITFSEGDLLGILADLPQVPSRCLYFEIGPDVLYLLFPTNETPRIELETLRAYFKQSPEELYRMDSLPEEQKILYQLEQVIRFAQKFKLGYYFSHKNPVLTRVK